MIHHMRLHPDPFNRMESGQKDFEIRLNDEKRQCINVGDEIVFSKRPNYEDSFKVKVTRLDKYVSFHTMWQAVKDHYPNHTEKSFIKSMYEYYSPEEENKFGAIVINFNLSN